MESCATGKLRSSMEIFLRELRCKCESSQNRPSWGSDYPPKNVGTAALGCPSRAKLDNFLCLQRERLGNNAGARLGCQQNQDSRRKCENRGHREPIRKSPGSSVHVSECVGPGKTSDAADGIDHSHACGRCRFAQGFGWDRPERRKKR